ncbi:MAG: M3 family oligoendopeptidase, partial [Ignavibacteria bacterium]
MADKFKDFKYKRPDFELLKSEFDGLLREFNIGKSADEQYAILNKINGLRKNFDTMSTISSIRYTVNTKDKYYSDEHDYFDSIMPDYSGLLNELKKSLLESEYRNELEVKCGKQLFDLAEVTTKTFSPEIVDDLKIENKLVTEYVKLIALAKIMFEGEERNLAGMGPFIQSGNREVRKSANEARWKFFENNEKDFDRIYDELVKVRTKIAKKL